MRKLEDCKAEVFRRSEERIKERKRVRNRVLACCIPLCLLLVAGGLYVRPLLEPVDECSKSGGTNQMPERELGGLDVTLFGGAAKYLSVMVTEGTGSVAVSKNVTDAETVEELCGYMAMYFDMSGTKESYLEDGADGTSGGLAGTVREEVNTAGTDRDTIKDELNIKYDLEEPLADYKLVFRKPTGEEMFFRLYENNLYNEENGCVVKLSDEMSTELKKRIAKALEARTDK